MAGCVAEITGPTSFIVGFAISELINLLSNLKKEGLLMIKTTLVVKSRSFVKSILKRAVAFWEATVPFRQSLLMSL